MSSNFSLKWDACRQAGSRPLALRWASSIVAYFMLRLSILITAVLLPIPALAESTQAIRMRVVESGTNKPVAGAKVHYFAMAREGTFTGHGGRTAAMFDVQGESDSEGNIALPATRFSPRMFGIFGMNTNYENAVMTITKSNYAPIELRNNLRIVPNLDEVTSWEYQGRTVELKPVPNVEPPAVR